MLLNKRGRDSKKAQLFGMPFSMIFSIVIIIAVLVVAFYVIGYFLKLQKCSESGLFLSDLENEVKEAYESPFSDKIFSRSLPSSIKLVCIADITQDGKKEEEREMITELRRYANQDSNVFLYPPKAVCVEGRSKHIDYLEEKEGLNCFDVNNGKVEIRIKRDYTGEVQLLQESENP
jgi:hypothetical protein